MTRLRQATHAGRGRKHPMMDNKNTIIAIVLSAIVLLGWQYFIGMPQMEKQRQEALLKQQQQAQQQAPGSRPPRRQPGAAPGRARPGAPPQAPGQAAPAAAQVQTRAKPCSPRARASRSTRRA